MEMDRRLGRERGGQPMGRGGRMIVEMRVGRAASVAMKMGMAHQRSFTPERRIERIGCGRSVMLVMMPVIMVVIVPMIVMMSMPSAAMAVPATNLEIAPGRDRDPAAEGDEGEARDGVNDMAETVRCGDAGDPDRERDDQGG